MKLTLQHDVTARLRVEGELMRLGIADKVALPWSPEAYAAYRKALEAERAKAAQDAAAAAAAASSGHAARVASPHRRFDAAARRQLLRSAG